MQVSPVEICILAIFGAAYFILLLYFCCLRKNGMDLDIYWVQCSPTHYYIMGYIDDYDEYTDEGSYKTPAIIYKTKSKQLAKNKLFELYANQQ
jgi:hypothetical protein